MFSCFFFLCYEVWSSSPYTFCRVPCVWPGFGVVLTIWLLLCRARVWVIWSLFEFVQFSNPPAPSRGGDQGTLSIHSLVQDCLLFFCVAFILHFQISSSRHCGDVASVTSRFVCFSFSRLPRRHAGGSRKDFGLVSRVRAPTISATAFSVGLPQRCGGGL